jgi:hypothetical protein
VVRLTPSTSATSVKGVPAVTIRAACLVFAAVITVGRPPTRPLRRAAASPAMVRSLTRSRSNSANDPNTWNTRRPPGVVVSMVSCNDRNPTPRAANPRTVSIRCGNDRPNRSSRHTKVSPDRNASITNPSSGRSVNDPDAVSVQVRKHPAALRASCCNAASCSRVETLAYPSSSPTTTHCSTSQPKAV